jgi:hypothetical protein
MEKDRGERYAVGLERTVKNDYLYLKEALEDFQEMCRMVTPERNVPQGIVVDIREMYKEIRSRLTEIKAVEQLLQGKYRQYYRRDSVRDKEILEFGFLAKNCYSKFEFVLKQKLAQGRMKSGPKEPTSRGEDDLSASWFHFRENQISLAKDFRILKELDYEPPSGPEEGLDKRSLGLERSLTLFLLRGDPSLLDDFLSRIRFREHDIVERIRPDELRGALAHLKKTLPAEIEEIFRRLVNEKGFSQLRCLLLPVSSHQDIGNDRFGRLESVLAEMKEGEVKTLPS